MVDWDAASMRSSFVALFVVSQLRPSASRPPVAVRRRPFEAPELAPLPAGLEPATSELRPPRCLAPASAMTAGRPTAESASSASALSSLSTTAVATAALSSDPPSSASKDSTPASRPFIFRNGRPYLDDPKLPYPLPWDLAELHRQSLRTLLLCQLFGAPVCSPELTEKPPQRVLEVGCGSGLWSIMCHRYYKSRGHGDISFTGMDVVPLWPGNTAGDGPSPEKDMKWTFVKHDISRLPWPLGDKFDLIMVKDMSLAVAESQLQYRILGKYLRFLKPGGTIEIWDSDHVIRMLRQHVPESTPDSDLDQQEAVSSLGAYVLSAKTPLSASANPFLSSYNGWIERALEARHLSPVPCTLIGPAMLQESDVLDDIRSRRLAIPFGEIRWERDPGGGGPIDDTGAEEAMQRTLSADQSAMRSAALLTVVQQVQALEPILREASGKSQDEWDMWMGKMMGNLMSDGGASLGECLEVGVWWARKKVSLEEEVDECLNDTDE
ncbi:hypothetical protein CDD80_2413 [Ophiocordyceps camponoti-rufipedis]|uniref:Methyltransferase domain-containing protein n=1 Tax=Ophiocordyceps camponoti-rufipedis TaxID=2004952 RepID=A0A2C5ZKD2_9HYPO|nr:hypothetical protein CDD80_2413 [Ophiocordyceps camponoti-rufipedis]